MESLYRQSQRALIRRVGTRKDLSEIQHLDYSNIEGTEEKNQKFPGTGIHNKKRQGNKTVKPILIVSSHYFQSEKLGIVFFGGQNRLPKDSLRSPKCLYYFILSQRSKSL